jgi:hypothetical protein
MGSLPVLRYPFKEALLINEQPPPNADQTAVEAVQTPIEYRPP